MQTVGVALLMDRASIFVNFAVVQIDWLETDGTQEGLITAHEHPPSVATMDQGVHSFQAKREQNKMQSSMYPPLPKNPCGSGAGITSKPLGRGGQGTICAIVGGLRCILRTI